MKAVEQALDRPSDTGEEAESPLVTALAGALAEDGGLPAHLWERALLGPAREFLRRPGKRFRGRLVEMCWLLAGGAAEGMPAELPLVVELLHAGSLIIDDIQDGSAMRRGAPALHHVYGTALALNTGNWMYFWPLALIDRLERLGLASERAAELHRRVRHTLTCCHQGQALDLALKVTELEQGEVPRVVKVTTQLKTGALMELGAALGAVAAGASSRALEAMCRFGRELGTGLQMLDDLGAITSTARRDKGAEDLRLGRPTWPWAWAAGGSSPGAYAELQRRARRLAAAGDAGARAG
ncbi:MAG TPA: polyprenyl synthetase family protein, partial [Haliangium sp.]|nr:polyprenyl synthetase family protein [Haliangium sp.]